MASAYFLLSSSSSPSRSWAAGILRKLAIDGDCFLGLLVLLVEGSEFEQRVLIGRIELGGFTEMRGGVVQMILAGLGVGEAQLDSRPISD